jgi:Peptidase family M1 domain
VNRFEDRIFEDDGWKYRTSARSFDLRLKRPNPTTLFALILLLLCSFQAIGQPTSEVGKINADVAINLRVEQLSAKLKYDYIATEDAETVIKFYLNDAFSVKKVKCRLCQSFNFDRQAKPLPSLLINLKEPLLKGRRLNIEIEYDGSLKGIYKKDYKFLELGLDNFWFPIHQSIGRFNFNYRISIKTDEPSFQLVSNGRSTRKGKGWVVESKAPDFDIDLVLSETLKVESYRQGGYNLQVVSKNLSEEASATLLATMKETLDFYNSSFGSGDAQREVTAVFRPFPPIEGQGGYFRKGYFILPRTESVQDLIFPISHELAHYWWLNANQQNAWLNESFAEYSAMLALRKQQGVEAFNKLLEQKKNNSVNLPPVYGFDRTKNRQVTPGVFYRKGVVKLSELESELGEQKFLDFLRQVAIAKIRDTDQLIELLAQVASREAADRFLLKLKE